MKKQNYLKGLLAFLLLMVGAAPALAQTKIYATKQINFRTNSTEPTAWNNPGDWANPLTNKNGLNLTEIELNTATTTIFATEQFVIPNWSRVKSISITHKGTSNSAGLAVWLFPYTFYEANAYDATFVGNTHTVLGTYPGTDYTNTPAGTGTDAIALTVSENTINSIDFTSFISDDKLTLNVLLTSTNAATSQTKIYSAKTENADNRPYLTVTYNTAYIGSTGYETLADAFSAAVTANADAEIKVYDNQTLTARQTWNKAHSLTITPMADITIKGPNSEGWLWTTVNNAALTIGSDAHSITFDGDSKKYSANITRRENNSTLTLKNVTFENFDFNNSANALVNCNNSSGNIILDGVTINNSTNTSKGFIYSERTVNGQITLKGYLNLDATSYASAPAICSTNKSSDTSENGSIIVDDDSFTASLSPLKISWDNAPTTIGYGPLVTGVDGLANATSLFDFNDASYGFYADGDNLKLTQAYTATMPADGMSTLILPFTSTIPTGVSCYTLNYTSASSTIKTTAVETTLAANTPVLIQGSTGTYKFISTATSGDAATGSGTHTNGALTGVYEATNAPSGTFTLSSTSFAKSDGSATVAANNAYLTASESAPTPLTVNYGSVYTVTATKTGGSDGCTVTVNTPEAAENETISVTINSASGYELISMSYNDGTDHAIDISGATYTFTMPASNVTVNAVFGSTSNVAYIGTTGYETLEAAVTAAAENATIIVKRDATVSNTITFTKNLTIVPGTSGVAIKRATTMTGELFSLETADKIVTIGSSERSLVINGQNGSSEAQLINVTNGTLNLTNTTIQNYTNSKSSDNRGIISATSNGKISLQSVTFNTCVVSGTNAGLVFCGKNDAIMLSGANTFTNCTGYDFYLEQRIKVTAAITGSGYKVYVKPKDSGLNISVGSPVILYGASDLDADGQFVLQNPGYTLSYNSSKKEAQLAKIDYTVTTSPTDGSVVVDKTTAGVNDVVTITITTPDGKQLSALTVKDAENGDVELTTVTAGSSYTFTMPAKNVTVTATFTDWTSFSHPAMLHTAADLARVKGNLGLSPIKEALAHLQQSNYAQPTYTASPEEYLKRMDAENWSATYPDCNNYTNAMKDANAAYQLALRYQLEGSTACADAAVAILNAWATTNKGVLKDTDHLPAYPNGIPDPNEYLISIQGHQFANAAELLRGYSGWNATDFAAFKTWMKKYFADELAMLFLQNHHNNVANQHYWLNWDLAALTSILSIGILCDDKTLTDYAITYYKGTATTTGTNNSSSEVGYYDNAIPYVYAEDGTVGLGQCQESGRDQGHSMLDVALLGAFCQMTKNMGSDGEDLFATDSYRAVKMAEYVGKYNLNQDVTFTAGTYSGESHTTISADGRGGVRPVWELFYRYARDKGITAKYSQQWAENLRAENVWGEGGGGDYGTTSTGFDQLGYGTLMYADPTTADGQDTDATDYSAYNKSEKTPESDTYVRSTPADSKYGSDKQMEVFINNGESPAQFYGMLSFKLPNSAVGHVKKAQLRLVTKRYKTGRNINIFAYENFTEGEATYSNQSAAITAATGKAQLATFKPMGQNDKDVTSDATSIDDENKTLAKWTNKIDLTSYVQSLNSQEVNLLLADAGSGSNSNSVQFFTKECTALSTATTGNAFDAAAADLVPQLIIYHDGSSSGTFVIGDDVYDTLEDALAEVADGGTITVTGNSTIINRVTFSKSVTIKAKEGVTPVLTRKVGTDGKSTQGVLYNIGADGKTVTFEGITFDENNAKESPLFETSNTNRVFVLNSVTIKNSKCQKADGVLDVKGGGMTLNGVTFQNCAISNAFIRTNLSGDNSAKLVVGTTTFTGCTGHTIRLRKNSKLDANYLTGLSGTITIEVEDETPTITNVSDQSRFSLQSDGFGMSYANGTITFSDEGDGQDTAIDESAYAGKTISKRAPAGDTFVRSDNATSKYGSTAQVEIHTAASGSNDFVGLMSFSIPTAAIGTVVKAQLRLVTKQKKTNSRLSLYTVGAFEEGSDTYETMSDAITAARANAPIKKFRPKGTNGFDITSNGPGSSDKPEKVIPEADRELSKWSNYIDLTSYVQSLTEKNFYLMITETTPDDNTIQFFSKERTEDMNTSDNKAAFNASASDLVPQLVVVFSEDTSNRKTFYIAGEGSYDTLDEAIEAAQDGDVITVTKNATVSTRATFTKSVTLKAESGVVLTRGSDEAAMKQSVLFKANSGKTVTFDGITFNDNQATVGQLIEVDNNTFVLKNMTVKNSKSSSANGVVSMKRGTLTVEGITFTDCAITNAYLRAAAGTLNFSGSYTLNGSTGNHFRLGDMELNAATLPAIDGAWRIEVESEGAKITNVSDQNKFSLETIGYTMHYASNTITFTEDGDGQDTSEIVVPDGCVKKVVTANLDTYVRKGDSSDNGKKQQVEVFTFYNDETDADFVGLMAFRLPDDLTKQGAKLEKAQLRLVSKRVKGSRIIDMYQLFTDFSESATYDQMEKRIDEARDNGRMHRFKARGMDNMDIVADSLKLTDEYKNIENWTNKLDLTSTVANVMYDDGILRFALSAPINANNAKQFFTKEAQTIKNAVMTVSDEYLIPELTLVYTPGSGPSALTAKTVESEANMDLFLRKGSTADNSVSECIEVYTFQDDTKDQDFVGLLSFNLTDEVAAARNYIRSRATTRAVDDDLVMFNATLRLVTKRLKGERDMNVFIFDEPFSNKSTYAELESAIADARANNTYVTFKTAGMADKDVTSDAGLSGDYGKSISAWTNMIDVTDLVKNSDSKTLNVMLSAPNNERSPKQYFSSEAESFTNNNYTSFIVSSEDLVPLLTVTYRNPLYTEIEERITIPVSEDNIIYDLRGNRVQTAGKGIYIINGKKVLKK